MKKHIVLISNEIAKDKGGIQNMCYSLANYFSEEFEETIICSSDSDVKQIKKADIIKSKYSSKEISKFKRDIIHTLFILHHRKKIDFVISALYNICSCAYLLKKMYGVPYGIMAHGNEVYGDVGSNKLKIPILNFYRYKILKNANIIFANSIYTKNLVLKITKTNIVVISPPVEIKENDKSIIVNNNQSYELFSIARHVKRKGFQLVIESLPKLIDKYPKIHYNIAGSGEYTDELIDLVSRLKLNDRVTFLGRLTEEEKRIYFEKCSLFIMPSFSIEKENSIEGFGIVYIEANSYGKFVIGSKSGGIPDAIVDGVTGFLAEENDIDSVVECIDNFFNPNFEYDPIKCTLWAKKHSVDNIGKLYQHEILKIVDSVN